MTTKNEQGAVSVIKAALKALDTAATKVATSRPTVIAAKKCPPDQCIGCGRKVKPNGTGIRHCNRPVCVRKAASKM